MMIQGADLENPAPPLSELLGAGLGTAPDEPAVVSAGRSVTWGELDRESSALAEGYLGLGLERGTASRLSSPTGSG